MKLRTVDYAFLSKDAYLTARQNNQISIGGVSYTVFDGVQKSPTGFQAVAYRRNDTHETVIAYCGTSLGWEPWKDGLVDAGMMFAGVNAQAREAEQFTARILAQARRDARDRGETPNVTVTGHSLGGTLAQINAAKFGLRGETFNAYGASGLKLGIPAGGHDVINHVRATDPVSAASPHFGEVRIYAHEADIHHLARRGHEPDARFHALRTTRAINVQAHAIENFVPNNGVLGESIIHSANEHRYRSHQPMIDHYRADIADIRKYAAVAWETRVAAADGARQAANALLERVTHGGRTFASAVGTGGPAVGTGVLDTMRTVGLKTEPAANLVRGPVRDVSQPEPRLDPPRLDMAAHPDHALFKEARAAVHRLDAERGRQPDRRSDNLAGALTVEARRQGMNRVDHVLLSDDTQWAYAVQGSLDSPFKRVVGISTEKGIADSLDRSTAALDALVTRQTHPLMEITAQSRASEQDRRPPVIGH